MLYCIVKINNITGVCALLPAVQSLAEYGRVYWLLCPITDISATVASVSIKFCMMVHINPRFVFSPLGAVPLDPGTLKSEYLENGKSQRYMPVRG